MPRLALFDFRDPLPMPPGAQRLVADVTEAVPRVGLLLGSAAGRPVTVTCGGVRRVALVEIAADGDVWAPLLCGLPGTCLLLVPRSGTVALADLLLGGRGEVEDRRPTGLEQQLIVRHVVPSLRPLVVALAEYGVQDLAAGPPTDDPLPAGAGEVVAVLIEAALPSGATSRMVLCLPARSLLPAEPARALPAPGPAEDVLGEVPVDLSLRLPATVVTAEDLEDLSPGDVLRIDPESVLQLSGVLEHADGERAVLTAGLGRRGRRRAVVVHELLGESAAPAGGDPGGSSGVQPLAPGVLPPGANASDRASFDRAPFDRASFERASFDRAPFDRAPSNPALFDYPYGELT